MKLAIVGSRNLRIFNMEKYLPIYVSEIVSGGAKGVDTCARSYAIENNIKLTEFLPDYERFSRSAPLKRNIDIIEYADMVIAFWDGRSKGTRFVINECEKRNIKIKVFICDTIHSKA